MSGGIEEPYAIASLPKPLDKETGRTLGAPVHHRTAGSLKRKRREVAIGVDGESVSIYNAQNQSIVSQYALPPRTYLAVPPCSIYCKRAKPLQPQRQTYLAVQEGAFTQKARLVSIKENLGKPTSDEPEPRAPVRFERKLRHPNIVAVDTAPLDDVSVLKESDTYPVIVSYENGDVDCIEGNMSAARWEYSAADNGVHVEYSAVVEFEDVRRGLLKNREDVLALLDSSTHGAVHTTGLALLCQVRRTEKQRALHIYAIGNTSGQSLEGGRPPLDDILTYELPTRHIKDNDAAQYELHAATGMLYQHLGNRLTVFDLSGTSPKVTFELGRKSGSEVKSFIRLSSATVLTVTSEKLEVHDIKYGSTLSSLAWSGSPSSHDDASAMIRLITRFSDLSIVMAISSTNLIAFQVGDILDDGRRSLTQEPMLRDVLGKGNTIPHEVELKDKKKRKWDEWKAKVDRFFATSDAAGLEAFVAKMLKLEAQQQEEDFTNAPNGYHDDNVNLWDLPSTAYDPQHVEARRALYLLQKLFLYHEEQRKSEGTGSLRLALLTRNVLRFLTLAGYLTTEHIQRVISSALKDPSAKAIVAPGAIMQAVAEAEPNLTLMCDLISMHVHWELSEVVQGLQVLIRSLQDKPDATPPSAQLITGDVDMADGDVQSEIDAVEKELDRAAGLLESGGNIYLYKCGTTKRLFPAVNCNGQADDAGKLRGLELQTLRSCDRAKEVSNHVKQLLQRPVGLPRASLGLEQHPMPF